MDTGFFKWLWRFNAVALAILLMLAVCAVLWVGFLNSLIFPDVIERQITITESPAETDITERKFLDVQEYFPEQEVYHVRLYTGQIRASDVPAGMLSYKLMPRDQRKLATMVNLGHMDSTGALTWMFEKHAQYVANVEYLYPPKNDDRTVGLPLARLLSVVHADTNTDGALSQQDDRTLYLAPVDGLALTQIVAGVQDYSALGVRRDGVFALILKIGDAEKLIEIDLTTFQHVQEITLPTVE